LSTVSENFSAVRAWKMNSASPSGMRVLRVKTASYRNRPDGLARCHYSARTGVRHGSVTRQPALYQATASVRNAWVVKGFSR
jgi:hypothetical protein